MKSVTYTPENTVDHNIKNLMICIFGMYYESNTFVVVPKSNFQKSADKDAEHITGRCELATVSSAKYTQNGI